MNKPNFSTKKIAYTALMMAMVIVATLVLKIQTATSYTTLGDTFIFLTAMFLGPGPALIAGGIGSFLADVISYPLTMWFTLVIKGLEGLIAGLFCYFADKKIKAKVPNVIVKAIGLIIAAAWMIGGYFIAKAFMYGTMETAMLSIPKNVIQGAISVAFSIGIYLVAEPIIERITGLHSSAIKEQSRNDIDNNKQE